MPFRSPSTPPAGPRSALGAPLATGLVVVAACAVLAGCTPTAGSSSGPATSAATDATAGAAAATDGGTLRIVSPTQDVDALDPIAGYSTDSWELLRATTRQLVTYPGSADGLGADTHLQGDLADRWDVGDGGRTYTFHLRAGIHYSGSATRAIVAGDFVYAAKRLCDPNHPVAVPAYLDLVISGFHDWCHALEQVPTGDPAAVRAYVDAHDLPGIRATDDRTLVLHADAPAADALAVLALPFLSPLPEEVVSRYLPDSAELRAHYPSSGPYAVTTYRPGDRIVLTRTGSDPARAAYAAQIVVELGAGTVDRVVEELADGRADLSLYLAAPPAAVVATGSTAGGVQVRASDGAGLLFLVPNTDPQVTTAGSSALRDLRVRQAVELAVDKAALVAAQGGPTLATATGRILLPTQVGHAATDPYETPGDHGDPARARTLLATAGHPDGLALRLVYRPTTQQTAVAQALRTSLARAGIDLELTRLEPQQAATYVRDRADPWDLLLASATPDWQGDSARTVLGGWLDGRQSPCGPGNVDAICFSDADLDAAVDRATSTGDAAAWADADDVASRRLALLPLLDLRRAVMSSARVTHWTWSNVAGGPDVTNLRVPS